ncbi:MAG: hypothetical protein ABJD38_03035, partial [Aurantimonas coralicida]
MPRTGHFQSRLLPLPRRWVAAPALIAILLTGVAPATAQGSDGAEASAAPEAADDPANAPLSGDEAAERPLTAIPLPERRPAGRKAASPAADTPADQS